MDGGFRNRPAWLIGLAIVALGQLVLALERFGGWSAVCDDRPIVDGRHPLHLYHATLGAERFRLRYSTACFDPAFQAGYPKTPVFDGGCRPGELMLLLAGSHDPTSSYKLGLFAITLLVPMAFAIAARGLGLSAGGAVAAAALGACVWWAAPVQSLFEQGDIDLLLAGLAAIAFVSWLSRYHWDPSPTSWLMLALPTVLGWYAQPVVWLGLLPVVALYYIAAAPRHGPAWHLGLVGVSFAGLAPNMWWLWDWGKFWWLRQPSVDDLAPIPTWGALLRSTHDNLELLGEGLLGWPLIAAGLLAAIALAGLKRRSAAFVLVVTAFLSVVVARLGETWPPFINGGAERAAPLIAALAALALAGLLSLWAEKAPLGKVLLVLLAVLPATLAVGELAPVRGAFEFHTVPLNIGLSGEQEEYVRVVLAETTVEARILLEDIPPGSRPGWNWTALLPMLTGRSYLGGLDPDARFEHFHCGLIANRLTGKPLMEWSDDELVEFARRYNVGWVAARSPETIARWQAFPMAREIARFRDGGDVVLFSLNRAKSFILTGQAKWDQADRRKVVLTDLVPAEAPNPDGGPVPAQVIVLSLHHQPGIKVSPNIVIVERDPCAHDPIPMIRLRMTGPLSRVVISWENR